MPNVKGKEFLKKSNEEIDNEYESQNKKELQGSGRQDDTQNTQNDNQGLENSKEKFASEENNSYINSNEDSNSGGTKEDANFDPKYVSYLKDTYGFSDEDINEKTIKIAKSDIEKQRYGSQLRSELEKYKKTVQGVESVFEKNPSLYDTFQKTLSGDTNGEENQQPQESNSDKPTNRVDKLGTVTEKQLIEQGYLEASSLEGLSDYERKLEIKSAAIDYKADKRLQEYEQGLQNKEVERNKKSEQKSIKEENQRRFDEGLDNLIAKYRLNLDENPELYNKIAKRAAVYRDLDTKYIDEKAVELAAQRELGDKLELRESQRKEPEGRKRERDTGFNVNKSNGSNTSGKQTSSLWDKIDEKASYFDGRGADRKAAFNEQVKRNRN